MEFIEVLKVLNAILANETQLFMRNPSDFRSTRVEMIVSIRNELMQTAGMKNKLNASI